MMIGIQLVPLNDLHDNILIKTDSIVSKQRP